MKRNNKILFLIFSLWGLLYLVYPSWLWPIPPTQRVAVLGFFVLYFGLNAMLLLMWNARAALQPVPESDPYEKRSVLVWKTPCLLLILLSILLHLYPMQFAIRDDDDEAYHVANALTLKEKAEGLMERVPSAVPLSQGGRKWAWIGGGSLLFALWALWRRWGSRARKIVGMGLGIFSFLLLWRLLVQESYMPGLLLHPPLAKLLNLLIYTLLGISEFKIRILSLLFSILASLLIFKMASLYRSRHVALIAALLILFLPNCFYYAGVAELGAGTLFFSILLAYLALVSLRTQASQTTLLWFVLAGGAAFFYHRMTVVMIGVLFLFFLWMWRRGECTLTVLKRWLGAFYFASVPILLWLLIGHFLVYRKYYFAPSHLVQPEILLRYLLQMPSQTGDLLFFLFLAGLVKTLLWKKDPLAALCLTWFFLAYLFLTGDVITRRLSLGVPRYSLIFYGPVAIIIADLLGKSIQKLGVFGSRFVVGLLLTSLLLIATVVPMPPVEARYTTFWQRQRSYYAIYEEAIPFMMKTLPKGAKIFDTSGSNHFKFYVKKYQPSFVWNQEEYEATQFELRSPIAEHFLYKKCREDGFEYVFCWSGTLSTERFRLVKAFDNGTRKRYLWKVLQ